MTTVRLLLFDVDGTLVLGNRSNRRWFGEALIEVFGAAGDIDAYSFSGKIDPQIVTELLTGAGVARPALRPGFPRSRRRTCPVCRGTSSPDTCDCYPVSPSCWSGSRLGRR